MNFKNSAFKALAIVLATSVASAAEDAWPKNSASDLSMFVITQKFRIYADHCSAEVPQLKQEFESRMEALHTHIQDISKGLLASEVFRDMRDKPVPAEIVAALEDNFDDSKHNFERLNAASACPKALQGFREMNDESLTSGLTEVLASVQNMIQVLEKQSAR